MLTITVPETEWFDEDKSEFIVSHETTLVMEHSLIALSKWESKWKKSFLDHQKELTPDEFADYFRCMTITQKAQPLVYRALWVNIKLRNQIIAYINDPMSAVKFKEDKEGPHSSIRDSVTSDLIYYWMIASNIPSEYEKWHINRLLTLIRICGIKGAGDQKTMSKADLMRRNRALNAARRKKLNSRG